jgi:hypothetical protein
VEVAVLEAVVVVLLHQFQAQMVVLEGSAAAAAH